MKKFLLIVLTIAMLFSTLTTVSANEELQKNTIRVGICADFPPFEYYNENGELYGFDIDLMNYIGERTGYEIEYIDMDFDALIPAVETGKIDCVISAIAITKERDEVIDYTIPYLRANVTYLDEEASDTWIEQYAIVFPNNSVEKGKVLEASGNTSIYNLVNKALSDLIKDKTAEKLGEKYNLKKSADTSEFDYEYTVMYVPDESDNLNSDKSNLLSNKTTSATSVPCSEWATADIEEAIRLGIADSGKSYNFPGAVTREEFCELIYNYCYNVIKNVDTVTETNKFDDTTNAKIIRLNAMGIINGKSETKFAPSDYLTREEAAVILHRMVNKTVPVPVTEMYYSFDDEKSISDWAADSVQVMCNMGVMNGIGENKFAPQETYTTEQAIATIVRVYAAQSANIGIIGSSDGPTAIFIGGVDKSDEITVTDTIKIDSFYTKEAIKLICESAGLAADKNYVSLYTADSDVVEKITALGAIDFNTPSDILYLSADIEKIIDNITALAEAEGVDMNSLNDAWTDYIIKRFDFTTLASLINSSYGTENLAALTTLTNSRGYIMPKDFENNFALYLRYDGDYSAIVSFTEFGEGVIKANMSFVKNGDKDNLLRRLYEITSVIGKDGLKVATVEQ